MDRLIPLFVLMLAAAAVHAADPPPALDARAGPERAVAGERQRLEAAHRASIAPIDAHLQPILTPVRSVALAAPGRASPPAGSAQLQVVGPLPEEDLVRLLSDVPLDAPPWKIVADMRHARLYFGRPGVDPCCFEEWTYVRDADAWWRVDVRSYSH